MNLHDLPTPALLVNLPTLDRNLQRMAEKARRLGVRLRPHIKTHKTLEVARRQRDLGARGLTVSTLEEARLYADHGFEDLTWAFPVIPGRLGEARTVDRRARLRLVVDSRRAFEALESFGHPFHVFLKVDCGYHRCGVEPSDPEATELARELAGSGLLHFDGLLTHSGQSYDVRGRSALAEVAETERRVMAGFAAELRKATIEVPEVSVGSTPAMSAVEDLAGITEARPGNYCYYDYTQASLGSCEVEDCALTVLSTVISSSADHSVVDAGALALSKDPGPAWERPPTAGRLLTEDGDLDPERWLTALSQEHGKLDRSADVGSTVRILPHHSCLANACFDTVYAVEEERVLEQWRVWRGR